MTRTTFNATISPKLDERFRASSWARQSSKVKSSHYARWYIYLVDKYSNHKASFDEISAAVSNNLVKATDKGYYGAHAYFTALTFTPYYKYRIIHTKAQLCDNQTI